MAKKLGLILLALLIAGLIIVGYYIKRDSPAEKNREELALLLNTVSTDARAYYQKQNTFTGWEIPKYLQVDKMGRIMAKGNKELVRVIALGNEIGKNGISKVKLEFIINMNHSNFVIRN